MNATLGGYFNKVVSFWLMKAPEAMLTFIAEQNNFVGLLFDHVYLTDCVTDLLVRLCAVK